MMRDVFVLRSFYDLDEFIAEEVEKSQSADTVLGVGFYSVRPAKNKAAGIEIQTTPPHLKSKIIEFIAAGQFSPLEDTVFFVGGSAASVTLPWTKAKTSANEQESPLCRWLLLGLVVNKQTDKSNSAEDLVREYLSRAFQKVLSLRPGAVVVLADAALISQTLNENGLRCNPTQVLREIVNFLVEENVHPRTALLCRTNADFDEIVAYSRSLLMRSPHAETVQFRL